MLQNTLFTTLALCAAAVSAADPVTTQILLAGFEHQDIVGSVVTSDLTATTFSIACATFAGATCNIPADFTFTQGPSTIHYVLTHTPTSSDDFSGTIDVGCAITTDHGTCSKFVNAILGTITSTATSSTTTFSGASEMGAQVLTITGGKLATPTTASLTSSSTSFSTASKNSTSSSTFHSATSYSFSNSSSTASSSSTITPGPITTTSVVLATGPTPTTPAGVSTSSVSTGGMAMVTGSAQWFIGGVAAVAVFAAL